MACLSSCQTPCSVKESSIMVVMELTIASTNHDPLYLCLLPTIVDIDFMKAFVQLCSPLP